MTRNLTRWVLAAFATTLLFSALMAGTAETATAQPAPVPVDAQPAPAPADAQPAPEADESGEPERMFDYPIVIQGDESEIVVYQPQLESFENNKMTARAAISVKKTGQEEPVFGAMWIEGRADTDRDTRTVNVSEVKIPRIRIPDAEEANEKALAETIAKVAEGKTVTLSLDQVLAMLAVVEKSHASVAQLETKPPAIVYRDHAAVLIQFSGEPRMKKASDGKLLRAVNTPYFVVLDPDSKTYYLKGGGIWYSAPEALGPYAKTDTVPDGVKKEAETSGYVDPEEQKPAEPAAAQPPAEPATDQAAEAPADEPEEIPEIVTATEPTELVWTDGPAEITPITGTNLLYAANTDSDVFLDMDTQSLYLLLSGRWYTAETREGPWTFVSAKDLPPDFQKIPPGSEKSDVLASIPGTETAQDAILDNSIPQTAAVDRKNVKPPQVVYDGPPQFKPIDGTTLSYAINTPFSVIQLGTQYYCCADAVWFMAADPNGPWELCTTVPPEIYGIPPSAPVYPVTYVYVYESDDPDTVYYGYTPGYVGSYIYDDVVVYGTGYDYDDWWGEYYYPWPRTYGYAAHYNPYYGTWGHTVGVMGPNGWIAYHDGSYGTIIAGGTWNGNWWGSGGYNDWRVDPDYDTPIRGDIDRSDINLDRDRIRRGNNNIYNRRNDIRRDTAQRPLANQGLRAQQLPATRDAQRPISISDRDLPRTRPSQLPNDVFTDREGNVYRRDLDGWQQRDQGQWVRPDRGASAVRPAQQPSAVTRPAQQPRPVTRPAQRPSTSRPAARPSTTRSYQQSRQQLDRDYRARSAGKSRASSYQRSSSRSSSSRSSVNRAPSRSSSRSSPARSSSRSAPRSAPRGGSRGGRR